MHAVRQFAHTGFATLRPVSITRTRTMSSLARTAVPAHVARQLVYSRKYSTEKKSEDGTEKKSEDGAEKKPDHLLPSTGPLSPFGIALFSITAGGILYYFTVNKRRVEGERKTQKTREERIGKPNIGGPFTLIDQDGKPVTEDTFRGKFALIYFGFCHCPDVCPDELDKIGEALEILDKNERTKDVVQPVFITCDPQRDSPEAIKKYLGEFHSKFVGLTGSVDQVRTACKAYRVYFSKPPKVDQGQDYLVDHSIFSYFMDPDGQFIEVYGKEKSAQGMAEDIEKRVGLFLDSGRKIEKN